MTTSVQGRASRTESQFEKLQRKLVPALGVDRSQ